MLKSFSNRFTTQEIVLMAMLAAANGVLTIYLGPLNKFLTSVGGPAATSVTAGMYMIYGLLACYIIRKPGTAVITFGLGGTIQALSGPVYGMASCFAAAACYMAAFEVLFALFRYKRWGLGTMMLAGGAAVPLWFAAAIHMFGYTAWPVGVLVAAYGVRIVSGMVLCGLLSKKLGDALARTGLLRRFAISSKGQGV